MRHRIRTAPALTALVLVWVGCQKAPEVRYAPPIEFHELAAGLPSPDNTYLLLTREETVGRFACGLAIAKVGRVSASPGDWRLGLMAPKPTEEAYWIERLRGLSAVRDVLFVSPYKLRGEDHSVPAVCAAAERLGASLLLIYAGDRFDANAAQVLGVLYDVKTRAPVATLHASTRVEDEGGEQESPDGKRGDRRASDAGYQALRCFETHTSACLRELIARDRPVATVEANPWETPPQAPRWWVPKIIRLH